jgi:hypothetical protein
MQKYHNKVIYVGNEKFDSKKEYARWRELQLMQRAGEISFLKRQEPYVLIKKSQYGRDIVYVADFVYFDNNKQKIVVEDVKSPVTAKNPVYKLKKRLLAEEYGLVIQEYI